MLHSRKVGVASLGSVWTPFKPTTSFKISCQIYKEICYSKTHKSVEKLFERRKMENPDFFHGMGVAEFVGDKFNSILNTSVLQIKVFPRSLHQKTGYLTFFFQYF